MKTVKGIERKTIIIISSYQLINIMTKTWADQGKKYTNM
jgi:hypothetical protein